MSDILKEALKDNPEALKVYENIEADLASKSDSITQYKQAIEKTKQDNDELSNKYKDVSNVITKLGIDPSKDDLDEISQKIKPKKKEDKKTDEGYKNTVSYKETEEYKAQQKEINQLKFEQEQYQKRLEAEEKKNTKAEVFQLFDEMFHDENGNATHLNHKLIAKAYSDNIFKDKNGDLRAKHPTEKDITIPAREYISNLKKHPDIAGSELSKIKPGTGEIPGKGKDQNYKEHELGSEKWRDDTLKVQRGIRNRFKF